MSDPIPNKMEAFSGAHHARLLDHVLVLDLADETGSFCSKLLADLGATVIKVEYPDGGPSRKSDTESFQYNNANKITVVVNFYTPEGLGALRSLIRRADVIVEAFNHGCPEIAEIEPKAVWFDPRRLRRINPRLIHISITPFGRISTSGSPRDLPHYQPYRIASLFAAVAALIRLEKRKITGKGSHVDISIHEAVASMLEGELTRQSEKEPRGSSINAGSEGKEFSAIHCRDGYVQIPIVRCWDTLAELITSMPQTGYPIKKGLPQLLPWQEQFKDLEIAIENWARHHSRRELVELGQAMGFPWASIDSIEETLENPQLKSRNFFVSMSHGETEINFPGMPYKFSACPPYPFQMIPNFDQHAQLNSQKNMGVHISSHISSLEARGKKMGVHISDRNSKAERYCSDETILAGTRVLDLTRMISGPYATRIFADFGAEVIKIQSERTYTGAERNDSPQFAVWNRNKRSVTLDLNQPDARKTFLKLAAISDVIVENYSPRVMANWGLEYERLRAVNPALVMVSISAMGQTGPWRNFVGFAPNFHAFSGLIAAAARTSNLPPTDIGYPYADIATGLYAALATLAALEFKNRTGKGQYIDLSVLEAICTLDPRFGESQSGAHMTSLQNDSLLVKRRFFVSSQHPVFGEVLATRTPLWDWRRKPKWKAAPLLGEDNNLISDLGL